MGRTSNKDLMLDAAEAVVMDEGSGKLTLDAVAERAGVSKGGVLYHFPTKDALLESMMERMIARSRVRRSEILAEIPEGPGRELKAELQASLVSKQEKAELCAGILAAVAYEPKLMEAVKTYHKDRFSTHTGGKSGSERKALILLAADGLFLLEMLQVSPFNAAQRKSLINELFKMTEEVSSV